VIHKSRSIIKNIKPFGAKKQNLEKPFKTNVERMLESRKVILDVQERNKLNKINRVN
jgi:hypothetical protein